MAPPPSSPEDLPSSSFSAAVSKVSVAQICISAGFTAAEPAALRCLSDVAVRFIAAVARSAAANSRGRTDCNLFDVIRAMESLARSRGFAGASDHARPLMASAVLADLTAFARSVDEIPFPKPIRRRRREEGAGTPPPLSFAQAGRASPFSHVPTWLPCFPDSWERSVASPSPHVLGWRPCSPESGEEDDVVAAEEEAAVVSRVLPAKRKMVRFRLGFGRDVPMKKMIDRDTCDEGEKRAAGANAMKKMTTIDRGTCADGEKRVAGTGRDAMKQPIGPPCLTGSLIGLGAGTPPPLSFAQAGRASPFSHVPRWLPCFPDSWERSVAATSPHVLGWRPCSPESGEEDDVVAAEEEAAVVSKVLPAKRKMVRFRLGFGRSVPMKKMIDQDTCGEEEKRAAGAMAMKKKMTRIDRGTCGDGEKRVAGAGRDAMKRRMGPPCLTGSLI